jgi:Raf kinase inhibitor-like YbhB/YbcL family protein
LIVKQTCRILKGEAKLKNGFVFLSLITILFASNGIAKEVRKLDGLNIYSPAFKNNGHIPEKYTCDGQDFNPPILIRNVPQRAKSLALIVDDPDAPAGTWVHWVVWNIPPGSKEIRENSVPQNARQGINDFGKHEYGGPCPPPGTHRYFFKLYALDSLPDLDTNATKADLEKAMAGHIIEEAQTIGLYKRR